MTTIAGIQNVALCHQAVTRAFSRETHLPGMAVFYGPSGFGKSYAAAYAANKFDAIYVECKSIWTRKAFLQAIHKAMGLGLLPKLTLAELSERISEELTKSNHPLIIDEFDYLVDKDYVDVVRDLYESSQGSILLIGEEQLPRKLQKWERFHGRILEFFPAQPVSRADIDELKKIYAPTVEIDTILLDKIYAASKGSTRRVCVNLDRLREYSITNDKVTVTASDWGDRDFFTGEAPRRKVA